MIPVAAILGVEISAVEVQVYSELRVAGVTLSQAALAASLNCRLEKLEVALSGLPESWGAELIQASVAAPEAEAGI